MIGRHRRVFITALMCIVCGPRLGTARADEVQVNTYTTGSQHQPAVAMDADGDMVVVWGSEGSSGTDSSYTSIQGQRYAPHGSTVGGQFQVNTYTTSRQRGPAVAMDADGDFVVVWQSFGSAGTDSFYASIQGQRYASDGSTVGGQFQINDYTSDSQYRARVSLDADGDFVVVWESFGSGGTDSSFTSVQGRRYASDGLPHGGQFQINTYTTVTQGSPSVSLDSDGDFVVVWLSSGSYGTDSDAHSIQGQRYASDGLPLGGEFQVNTYTRWIQFRPSVSLDSDGDFVVVWEGPSPNSSSNILGQRYASDGSATGGEFLINTQTYRVQCRPSVSLDSDGNFVVVWMTLDLPMPPGPPAADSPQAQRFAAAGSTIGGELQIGTYTTNNQGYPVVSLGSEGDFVVVWQSYGSHGTDTDDHSIQRTPAGLLFADGFESGDTRAWGVVDPPRAGKHDSSVEPRR